MSMPWISSMPLSSSSTPSWLVRQLPLLLTLLRAAFLSSFLLSPNSAFLMQLRFQVLPFPSHSDAAT